MTNYPKSNSLQGLVLFFPVFYPKMAPQWWKTLVYSHALSEGENCFVLTLQLVSMQTSVVLIPRIVPLVLMREVGRKSFDIDYHHPLWIYLYFLHSPHF